MRHGNRKVPFDEQQAPGNFLVWENPLSRLRSPKLFHLRMDSYERSDIASDRYYDWTVKNTYLLGFAQMKAAMFFEPFVEYPPSRRPANFSIDQIRKNVDEKIDESFKKRGA